MTIINKLPTKEYEENWERIFKRKEVDLEEQKQLRQIGVILRYLKRKKIYYRMQDFEIVIPYYKER